MNDWTRISDGKVHHRGRFHGENNERAKHRRGNEGNMKATPDRAYIYIYFITHEKNRENSVKKKSSRVSFFKWPVKSRSLVGLMLLFFFFFIPRDDRVSRLFQRYFLNALARANLWQPTKKLSRLPRSNRGTVMTSRTFYLQPFFPPPSRFLRPLFYHVLSRLRSVSSFPFFSFFSTAPARWILKAISSAIYVRIRAN